MTSRKNCNQVGFDSTWDDVRSLLNPDRLMEDCDAVVHDGLDSTLAYVKSLLNPDRFIIDCVNDNHEGRDTMSVHAKFLLNLVSGMDD